MAIDIAFTADTSKVVRETKNIGDALEQVADELGDVGKDAKSLDDKVSDTFRNMGKDAKKAGDEIGDRVKAGTRKAGDGLEELKGESQSTAKEAAASFGSIEDAADALQEVAANAFAGFGPAGMAAGAIAAVGIGLGISALTEHADKVNENKEKMLGLAQTIRDNGGVLTEADYIRNMEEYGYAIQDTKEFWEVFQEDAISGFDKLRKLAEDTGLSTRDIFKGGFGDSAEAQKTLEVVQEKLEKLRDKKEAVYQLEGALLSPVEEEALTSLEESERLIQDNIQAQEDAAEVEATRREAIAGTTAELRENIDAQERQTDAVKGSISSELDYLDGLDALNAKLAENGATLDINTTAGRENTRAVIDQAGAIEQMAKDSIDAGGSVEDVTAKFNAQKDTLVNQVLPAFQGNRDAAQQYIDKLLAVPPVTKTSVQLEKEEAERRIEALRARAAQGIPMHISSVDGTAVDNWFMSQQGRKIFVEFAPRGGGQAIALP